MVTKTIDTTNTTNFLLDLNIVGDDVTLDVNTLSSGDTGLIRIIQHATTPYKVFGPDGSVVLDSKDTELPITRKGNKEETVHYYQTNSGLVFYLSRHRDEYIKEINLYDEGLIGEITTSLYFDEAREITDVILSSEVDDLVLDVVKTGTGGGSIENAVYSGNNFDVSTQDTSPFGIHVSPDGTKMFVVGNASDTVYQYTLSTPFDVSTASYDNKSLGVQDTNPFDLHMSPDGTKMYSIGTITDSVHQYTMSTPFDISTASYDNKSFSVAGQENGPTALHMSPDCIKLYISGHQNDTVYQYTMSTPFDVSTASYDNKSFSVATQALVTYSLHMSPNGTKMFIVGIQTDTVYQYTMSTPFDVSTASYDNKSFVPGIQDADVLGLYLSDDGSKLFVSVHITGTVKSIYQYNIPIGFDLENAVYDNKSFSISSQTASERDIHVSNDGTKIYLMDSFDDIIYQYTMSTPHDISTVIYDNKSFDVTAQDTSTNGVYVSNDGIKLFVLGTNTDSVYQYTMSTPFDISTASYDNVSFSFNAQTNTPASLVFSLNGSKMYISTNSVYQYSLSIPFDISTASYDSKSLDTSTQDVAMFGLVISDDGTKIFTVGDNLPNRIYQYDMSVPFDISTATYNNISLTVNVQGDNVLGLSQSGNGTKMYTLDSIEDKIFQYSTGSSIDTSKTLADLPVFLQPNRWYDFTTTLKPGFKAGGMVLKLD